MTLENDRRESMRMTVLRNHLSGQSKAGRPAARAVICAGVLFTVLYASWVFPGVSPAHAKELPSASEEIFAMDTYMTVSAIGEKAQEAVDASLDEIRRLDGLWSVGIEDSEISRLNRHESVELSEDTCRLLERALAIGSDTDGVFDITIYPLMQEWGFTTGEFQVPSEERLTQLLQYVNASQLDAEIGGSYALPDNVQIDLGGIAKGYTSDKIMDIFEEYGIVSGLVSLGGNVEAYRTKTDGSDWRVGIQNPDTAVPALSSAELIGIVQAADQAVITSGGYERYFEEDGITYHHILDPETGMPAQSGLISVTIISEDGCLADGLSTSLFVMGKEKALSYWESHSGEFDAILVEENGSVSITSGLDGSFTSDLEYDVVHAGTGNS